MTNTKEQKQTYVSPDAEMIRVQIEENCMSNYGGSKKIDNMGYGSYDAWD